MRTKFLALAYEYENLLVILMEGECDNIYQNMDFQIILLYRNQANFMRIGESYLLGKLHLECIISWIGI